MKIENYLPALEKITIIVGDFIVSHIGKFQYLDFKGERNLVTDIDKESEKLFKSLLKEKFPAIPVLGEELGGEKGELYWLIDPLNGTNNFAHTFPIFAISVALIKDHNPILAIIYDPIHKELFSAIRGKGSYLNNRKIKVSEIKKLKHCLLATGFYYEFQSQPDTNIEHFIDFLYQCQGIRRTGSACIDLAWVACARLDGFWELGLNPWDMAAGYLIVEEAGGKVSKLNGEKFDIYYPEILASNGLIHNEMIKVLTKRH